VQCRVCMAIAWGLDSDKTPTFIHVKKTVLTPTLRIKRLLSG